VGIPAFITTAVVSAYFPVFSKSGNPLTDEFAPLVNRAIHIVLFVTIPASLGLFFIADDLIRFIYDDSYTSSIVLVQILAFVIPIMAMDTVLGTALVASDRLSRYVWISAAAACWNPVACVFAIKLTESRYGNGAIGTSVVTVATELWIMAGAMYLRAPGVVDRTEVGRIVRILAASAAMVPVLLVSAGWPLLVQVLLGAATYGVATLLFGGITIPELRDVTSQFLRTRRGGVARDEPEATEVADAGDLSPPEVLGSGGDARVQP
jgi:O-antigen/teichoic acid export membrane protein